MGEKILQNQVRCNKCGDEPYSAHRHRNELGTICALFRVLRDNGYDLNNRSNEDE